MVQDLNDLKLCMEDGWAILGVFPLKAFTGYQFQKISESIELYLYFQSKLHRMYPENEFKLQEASLLKCSFSKGKT